MLVLSRKLNQEIRIGDNLVIKVVAIKGGQVRLGFVCPKDVTILREEVHNRDILLPTETAEAGSSC